MESESIHQLVSQKLSGHLFGVVVLGSLVSLTLWLIGTERARLRARIPGLKGPRGWPIIGNYFDIVGNAALKYEEWGKTYGDVYQVQLGSTTVVLVNTATAAKTIFLSNSHAVSSRPVTYTFHKVCNDDFGVAKAPTIDEGRHIDNI